MQVSDIMTNRVISVVPDEAIDAAIELMLKHHISGLPVIGDKGELVGIITESDFLRRPETSTEHKKGSRWRDTFSNINKVMDNYIHTPRGEGKRRDDAGPGGGHRGYAVGRSRSAHANAQRQTTAGGAWRNSDWNRQPRQLDARIGEHSPRGPRSRKR
jgi:CBS domain